ncbi:hypothetical protein D3C81_1590560 [compost metagenome]
MFIHNIVEFHSQICHNTVKDSISKEVIPMKESLSHDTENVKPDRPEVQAPTDSSIVASNAIKYTAYVMLLFGFLYFLIAYLAPML